VKGEKARICSISSPKNSILSGLAARRRKHVDDPPTDGHLAALFGALDALVAAQGELLGERLDTRFVAYRDAKRLRARVGGRQGLRESDRGGAHEAPGGEDLEGTRALADQVGRWLEARVEPDSAAREERHPLVAEEPCGGLGRIAGIRILGQEADEPPLYQLVESRDQEW